MDNQFKNTKYSGFTLVEMMVVILIITILLGLGSWAGLFNRRENARIEELAVNIVGLTDVEKTSALLGKTEGGEIVRQRKITIGFTDTTDTITYNSQVNLAKDAEATWSASSTKSWALVNLDMKLWECTSLGVAGVVGGPPGTGNKTINITFRDDTIAVTTIPGSTQPHIILQLIRNNVYREIHFDRRTGINFERAGLIANPSCT